MVRPDLGSLDTGVLVRDVRVRIKIPIVEFCWTSFFSPRAEYWDDASFVSTSADVQVVFIGSFCTFCLLNPPGPIQTRVWLRLFMYPVPPEFETAGVRYDRFLTFS